MQVLVVDMRTITLRFNRTYAGLNYSLRTMKKSEIFAQVFSNRWPSPEDLVKYAQEKHGYGGDDGYYGVTYPSDLDEYQKQVEGEFIPYGYVEVNYWDGDFKAIQIKEAEYLSALRAHLVSIQRHDLLKDWDDE